MNLRVEGIFPFIGFHEFPKNKKTINLLKYLRYLILDKSELRHLQT